MAKTSKVQQPVKPPLPPPIKYIIDTKDLETVLYRLLTELNLDEFSPDLAEVQVTTFQRDGAPAIYRGLHLMWPRGQHATIAFVMYDGKEGEDVAIRRACHPGYAG